MSVVDKARDFAIECHKSTNHFYDDKPYDYHLAMAVDVAARFSHLLENPQRDYDTVVAGCWVHDVIEDTRRTYNDVKEATNLEIAEIAFALTDDKGRNRAERSGPSHFAEIRANKLAWFVKLCDRIANIEYSFAHKSKMLKTYKKEYPLFKTMLYCDEYKEMFDYIESIFTISNDSDPIKENNMLSNTECGM